MPRFDLSLPELREYRPALSEPSDFDEFWNATLAGARSFDYPVAAELVDAALTEMEVFDITFPGFAGDPIKAWLVLPTHRSEQIPVVVEFNGYGGGRGLPHEKLAWVGAGYAYFVMDTRGQGSVWGAGGSTPDPHGSGPAAPGFLTRGIDSPQDFYYRRVYADAARAIDAVRTFDRIDPARVVVCGASQGGGIALAAAGLVPDVVAVMPDVPFLSNFTRAIGFTDRDPYNEVVKYLAVHRGQEENVYRTLSYFDGMSFAARATCPALYSVGLMDPVCPPSTVFASFNRHAGEAEIEIYPYNQHEGGAGAQWPRQAQWLADQLG